MCHAKPIFDPNFILSQIIVDQIFSSPSIFFDTFLGDQHFFYPKFCLPTKFFLANFFDKIFFLAKQFFDQFFSRIWNLGFGIWDLGFSIWDGGSGTWNLGPILLANSPFWPIGCGPALLRFLNYILGQIQFHFSTQLIPAVQANCPSLSQLVSSCCCTFYGSEIWFCLFVLKPLPWTVQCKLPHSEYVIQSISPPRMSSHNKEL